MTKKRERQNHILSILERAPGMSIHGLATSVNASDMTIRRDLDELGSKGYITIIQGVAILNKNQDGSTITKDYALSTERFVQQEAKRRIAALACTLLEPNDTMLVDTGTTTEQLFNYLPANLPLTIMCYNLNALLACKDRDRTDIIFAGGFYHRNTQMFESPEAASLISRIAITKFFASAAGISTKGTVTCIEQYELLTKQAAIKTAATNILMLDSSKFGKIRPCMFATIKDFDIIVTDKNIDPAWLGTFKECGIKYMIA